MSHKPLIVLKNTQFAFSVVISDLGAVEHLDVVRDEREPFRSDSQLLLQLHEGGRVRQDRHHDRFTFIIFVQFFYFFFLLLVIIFNYLLDLFHSLIKLLGVDRVPFVNVVAELEKQLARLGRRKVFS